MPYYISPPPTNALSRALAGVVAILALIAAFFFGLIVLGLVVGLGLLFWLGIRLRIWWMRHHGSSTDTEFAGTPPKGDAIDAEYTVVSRHED